MMLVVTYDVDTSDSAGQKRLRKVAKICERHGMRVQNSVFEVLVDASQLVVLKQELGKAMDLFLENQRKPDIKLYHLSAICRKTS